MSAMTSCQRELALRAAPAWNKLTFTNPCGATLMPRRQVSVLQAVTHCSQAVTGNTCHIPRPNLPHPAHETVASFSSPAGESPTGTGQFACATQSKRGENFSPVLFGRREGGLTMGAQFAVNGAELFATGTGLARRPFLHAEKGQKTGQAREQMENGPL